MVLQKGDQGLNLIEPRTAGYGTGVLVPLDEAGVGELWQMLVMQHASALRDGVVISPKILAHEPGDLSRVMAGERHEDSTAEWMAELVERLIH